MRWRRTTLNPWLRSLAAFSILVWLAAVSYCSLETFLGHAEAEDHHVGEAATHAAAHSHEESGDSHDTGKNGHDEETCCDSLQAPPRHGNPLVLLKPDLGKLPSVSFLWLVEALTFDAPETPPSRQAQHREWVFTPEVCLGPAFRSHAPPFPS